MTMQSPARREPLAAASPRSTTSSAGRQSEIAHDLPASLLVFRILTPSKTATGQPWLTGAVWPGWPLPQLTAPPSR